MSNESPKLSRMRKPEQMTLEEWQVALRRRFGRDQKYEWKNIGLHDVFSEFHVRNPVSGNTYRVAIRGAGLEVNFCSCPDFATNHLGTCKHIEFVLSRFAEDAESAAALAEGYQPPYSEVFLSYGPTREVRFRAGTECPAELIETASNYFDAAGVLLDESFSKFDEFLSAASAFYEHDLRCYDDALNFIAEIRDDASRRHRLDELFPAGADSENLKNLLRAPLYQYQREGALFAARAGRCLIGDDMGLGKTVQALAATEILARESGVERVLVICPTSLKHQWQREIDRFTARKATVIEGMQLQRKAQFADASFIKITNYDTIARDMPLIRDLQPDLVILDEAQRIKNWETKTAQAVKKIESPYAIVLTGTPLENRLEELVSIIQFVDRHRLGPAYRFLHEHQQVDADTGRVVGYRNLDKISETLSPILIRRTKADVLDELPERLEKNYFVPMTPQQLELHESHKETVARIADKWRRYGFLREADQRRLMVGLQSMRMACNSTFLLDHATDHSVKPDEILTLLNDLFETPDTKAVVFSQWTRTHELISKRAADASWKHVFFHGSVPSPKRRALLDEFRDDPDCRLFLSTDAGGVGLNLQHANVVINVDLPWNPAVLEQRIGRVHRIGQMRPVQVFNFIAEGTIEEGMLNTLAFKKSLFAGVLDGGEKEVFLGESRLKAFMETVSQVTGGVREKPPAEPEDQEDTSPTTRQSDAVTEWLHTGVRLLNDMADGKVAMPDADTLRRVAEALRGAIEK